MNPNDVVNQQEGIIYMDSAWNKSTTPKPGFVAVKFRTVSYADGRIIRTALNDDGSVLGDIDTIYDPEQQKRFTAAVKPGQQPPAEEPNPSDPTKTRVWDSSLNNGQGGWKEGVPIAPKPGGTRQVQSVAYENRGGRSIKITTYTDGTHSEEEAPPAAKPATPPQERVNPADPTRRQQWDPSANGGAGDWVDSGAVAKAPDKPDVRPDGKGGFVRVNPDGTVTPVSSENAGPPPPASASGWTPDPSKPDMGLGPRRADVAGMLAAGVFGPPTDPKSVDKANELFKGDYAIAQTTATNLGNIQSGEAGIYAGGITQRGQDMGQANNRLSAAQSIFTNAMSEISKLAPYQKKGSGAAYRAFMEILDKGYAYAERFGGLKDSPTIQPGPNQARTSDIFKPGAAAPAVSLPAAPGGAPAPGAPLPAVAPAAVPFAPPPTGAPRTAPATQGPYAPPRAPVAPVAPGASDYGPFDPPGYGPQPTAPAPTGPMIPGMTGPQPGDFPATPPAGPTYYPGTPGASVSDQAARAQAMIGPPQPQAPVTGGTLAWASDPALGFSPDVLAAWTAMQGQTAA